MRNANIKQLIVRKIVSKSTTSAFQCLERQNACGPEWNVKINAGNATVDYVRLNALNNTITAIQF